MLTETIHSSPVSTATAPGIGPGLGLLRFTTAGSVDDGKSTLVGRLLYDSKAIYEDQVAAVRRNGTNRSGGPMDLSLFTDGLRAEREQGITIDVAHRYFSTPKRKFIIADTPGHEQYTRNMATGASTADAAVVLIDACKGLLPQSRRHIYISALLGIDHVIAAVNKMDLAGYDESVFRAVTEQFQDFCGRLGIRNTYAIPVSALHGENVVEHGRRMEWYRGPALLELLESLPAARTGDSGPLRFPVQHVICPGASFRGLAGQVCSGTLRRGAAVIALPSGIKTTVKSIVTMDGDLTAAGSGRSVTVLLDDEIDLGRGDLLVGPDSPPRAASRLQANLVWLHAEPMRPRRPLLLKHTTRTVRATIASIRHRVDVNTLSDSETAVLQMNDIASVIIESTQPLYFDAYRQNRAMGSFILIDPAGNATVAAGMIVAASDPPAQSVEHERVKLSERVLRNGHPPTAVWLVNKPDLAQALEREIFARGWHGQILSGDDFDLDQLKAVARVLRNSGTIAILAVSADAADRRQAVEAIFGREHFVGPTSLPEERADALATLMRQLTKIEGGSHEYRVN